MFMSTRCAWLTKVAIPSSLGIEEVVRRVAQAVTHLWQQPVFDPVVGITLDLDESDRRRNRTISIRAISFSPVRRAGW